MNTQVIRRDSFEEVGFTAPTSDNSGDVIQLADGRAAIRAGLNSIVAGDLAAGMVVGHFEITKAASINILKGGKVYWDRTNGVATFKRVTGSFYLGVAIRDSFAAATTVIVDLNVEPKYRINSLDQNFTTALVNGATAVRNAVGSRVTLALAATSEAEKADALSDQVVATADGPILECSFTAVANGTTSAVNFFVGLVNGTNATAYTSITQYCGVEITGGSLEINATSTDGTTSVAATDTTVAAVVGTYNEVWIDARNPASVGIYVDGVQVLTGTTFVLTKATGPLQALIYLVKTTGTATGSFAFEFLRVRSTDLVADAN